MRRLKACLGLVLFFGYQASIAEVVFSESELGFIESHGPWPPESVKDPSNLVSGNAEAISLGELLFFDTRLSRNRSISCATCHVPSNQFVDSRALAKGLAVGTRNTPTLLNLANQRWYGWSGGSDSLWMQNIRPIVSDLEMGGLDALRDTVLNDALYRDTLKKLFSVSVAEATDDEILVMTGKLLAAYIETLVTGQTEFDQFRAALLAGDTEAMASYPEAAKRGLKTFTGRGRCSICHFGPGFSNQEFAEIAIPYFTAQGVDKGRYQGINQVKSSRYNLLGPFNDSKDQQVSRKTRFLRSRHDSFGQFRIPGLRSVARTAPYMHNGSLPTLKEVVEHYSHINVDRLHTDGESILKPLNLSDQDAADLTAFLESLNEQ